jgi:hypothetical protein
MTAMILRLLLAASAGALWLSATAADGEPPSVRK